MTAVEERLTITEPGVYLGVPHDVYLADPVAGGSLSSTGARAILPPGCPAKFRWEQANGGRRSDAFDRGSAAHYAVLGCGPEIVPVDAPDWRTKAAQQQRDAARARGAVPVLAEVWREVQAMADALRAHPVASRLLSREYGEPEATLVWRDDVTGVMLRSCFDLLPHKRGGKVVVADYKSTVLAEPEAFVKTAAGYGYHQQLDFYSRGMKALGLADEVGFLLVAQEVTPPYLVSVVQFDITALRIGALLNRRAIDLYARCKANDHWPGYGSEIQLVSLPAWYERKYEDDLS